MSVRRSIYQSAEEPESGSSRTSSGVTRRGATYDAELAGLEEVLTFTSLELRDAAMEDFDMEASLGFARGAMTRTYKLWETADPDQKRRLDSFRRLDVDVAA
jgi:hypothetical protein